MRATGGWLATTTLTSTVAEPVRFGVRVSLTVNLKRKVVVAATIGATKEADALFIPRIVTVGLPRIWVQL